MLLTEDRMLILNDLIKLAEKRNEEHVDFTINTSEPETVKFLKSSEYLKPDPLSDAIYDYLMELTFDDVKFVQTIMYIGRDESFDEDITAERLFAEKQRELSWSTQKIESSMIVEKMPLDDYLNKGIELIQTKL